MKRTTPPNNNSLQWAWVGTEVVRPSDITPEHRLIACGLSQRNGYPLCPNKYSQTADPVSHETSEIPETEVELDGDIIVISDDDDPLCTAKTCKSNPNCLNHLGQDFWEDEGMIFFVDLALNPHPCRNCNRGVYEGSQLGS